MHHPFSTFKSVDIGQRGLGDIGQRLGSEERLVAGDQYIMESR